MSTCVNLNSKDFKDCCNRLNVSAATLEPIVHEYINIEGNENSFPSDVYIEEKIHGISQLVLSDKQVKIWEERFSETAQFDHVLEAMSYITEAKRFFPGESIGLKETLDGKVEVNVARPYIETVFTKKGIIQKFRKSLFRGQGNKPIIDEDGNLILTATYDNLFNNYGKSFATSISAAYHYGEITSHNPYIIEIDSEYLDTIISLNEHARTADKGVRAIGDEYGGDEHEERLQYEGKIVIPKGKYKVSRYTPDFSKIETLALLDRAMDMFNVYNNTDNIMFGGEYSRLTKGISSYSDIKDVFNEIEDRIGKEAASYVFALYSQLDPISYVKSIYDEREDISDVYEDAIKKGFVEYNEDTDFESLSSKFFKWLKLQEEKQQIKKEAIANGTFMKAPNGQPTNLTEDQWLSVRTKEFKEWFGDWEKFTNISEELLEQVSLVFERNSELSKIGTIKEYAAYLKEIFPNSKDKEIYWHGSNSDFSQGFDSAIKGVGSGSPHIDGEFYLAKQAWTVLQYVNGVNRSFGPDINGFNHWNKLWWELKEIMSNGRRENNNWKNLIIGPDNVRQAIPNKKGIFNRDSGGENGKWLKERKADYGYQDKTDAEFFKDVFGIEYGKDTFNTWTQRNAEVFKSLVKTESGIYPAVINATNPIRESGKNTYYESERSLLTQAKTKGNDTILGSNTDNEFNSDVAVVFNAKNNVHFLGTTKDITLFKQWLEKNKFSKVVDENGEPLVVYHQSTASGFTEFDLDKSIKKEHRDLISFAYHFGTLQSAKEVNTHGYNGDLFSAFLNLRNPLKIEDEEQSKPIGILVGLNKRGLISREQLYNYREDLYKADTPKKQLIFIKNVLSTLGYDGYYYINAVEDAGSLSYAVFESNQIKSAEFNIGYSKEDDNIYHENEATNYTATRDARLEALREQEEASIVDLLNLIDSNSEYASIIDLLKTKKQRGKTPLLKGIKVKIVDSAITPESYDVKKLETSRGQYRRAYYDASSKTIIINSNGLFNGGRADSVILHEVIHAITVNRIKDNKEFRAEFDSIIEKYLEAFPHLKYRYGKDNNSHYMEEFIADIWSNTHTIEHLKSIKSDKKLTLWDKIRNFFIKLFAGSDGTLMADASDALYRLLDELETDTSKDTFYEGEFVFEDGTTVKAPFIPNEQQVAALNALSDFIDSDETHMTLSGYAGTGKTSLMEMLAEKVRKQYKHIVFSATTNKAAAVLKSKVGRLGFEAYTLNKVFGISVEVDSTKEYDAKSLVNVLRKSELVYPGSIVVIDEASMINEQNYRILNEIAAEEGIKIIYVGDAAQLAPVNERKISKVFRDNEGRVVTLDKVERTADNAILKEATALRSGKELSGESSFNDRGEGVAYIPQSNKASIREIIKEFVKGLKDNPDYFRILAFTNKAVEAYNRAVRNALGYTDAIPKVGEPMTGYANYGYNWRTRSYRLINSESYKVTEVQPAKTVDITIGGKSYTLEVIPITLEDSLGKKDSFDYVDIKNNPANLQVVKQLAAEKSRLWNIARTAKGDLKKMVLQQINTIEDYLFVNDNVVEGDRTLQAKIIDFGYALTIHKSQGSTFTHVVMDDVDISTAKSQVDDPNTYEVDLETGSVEKTTDIKSEGVNVQQQLRYVGVSRATDTVTIISDDVKSEDSPLNHIAKEEQFEEPTTPVQPVQEKTVGDNTSSGESVKGELIVSSAKASKFARQLTNPGNNLTVEYRGTTFRNAEHAYQTWKSGEFDEAAYKSTAFKPVGSKKVNKAVNFDIMVEIITAKLQQHPELIQGITDRGGLAYINNSTHDVTGDKYWESSGENKFIEALAKAYENVIGSSGFDNGVTETQETLPSKEELEAKVKEIQETLGCDEETAKKISEIYNEDSTEEDLKSSEEQLAELDAIFKDSLNVGEQIEALIDSEDITKSEIITIAYDIAYTISDLITTWHENPKELITKFGKPSEDIDKIKSMTRAEVVEYIGVSNLFDYVKEFYFGKVTDPNLMDKADVLYENFDAVIKFGTSAFASIEDFALTYSEVGYTVSNKSVDDSDSELTKDIEEASESGDKQEHWQIDSRTIDNFLSMSQIVKRELVRLYLVDEVIGENGLPTTKVRTNAFGMKKRVDPKEATNAILRWTRGALTLPEMVARLKEKQNSDPWIKPLISKLEDSTGKYTDFQSQFFTVFCKHFQEYYIVTEEKQKDGTTINKVIPVNINPALKEVMDSVKLLYELHAHPLFDSKGVKKDKLEELTKYVELLGTLVNESTPNVERIKNGIVKISELLGFKVDDATVELAINPTMLQDTMTNLKYIVKNLTAGAKQENYNPFEFKKGGNSIGTNLRNFLKPLTDRMEDVAIGAFYDSGKMYQSEVLPSWLSKTMDKFLTLDGKEYEEFLMKEYGKYEWFRNTKESDIKKGWRNIWLQRLAKATLAERKEMFGHHVQLNYLGHNYMRNMSSPEYVLATLGEFFNDTTSDKEAIGYSYYKIPMMSNKPSLEFIKFIRYKGLNYEDSIVNGLFNVFVQELMRIQTVLKRGYKKGDPQFIVPFDARGKHFLFLDYLEVYLNGSEKNSQLGILLNKKVRGEELPDVVIDGETMSGEDGLRRLVKGVIKSEMDAKAGKIIADYKAKGIFEAAKKISGVGKSDAEVEANLRNFIWNDTFAAINILQMTITDLAYYKNTEDVQKRLAQIHAPGMKGNINATDYNGERVCDGNIRAVFLADYEGDAVVQNIVENLEIVFDRKIESAKTDAERNYWESTKEAIIDGIKTSVNVADAQAYNCPTSYRKKALMFGKWSKEFEEAYEKLKKGEATIHDIEIAFQPLKPFVYTSTTKEAGVEGAPIQKMKVGMQFKNSEYLLILADAILQGEDTGRPNILRAIFEVMEESAEKDATKGIDTFMFASAVKAGLHGRIDLKDFLEGGDAKEYIKKKIKDATSADGYNATYVHTYPAEDYIIQQEVPKHFLDHSQAHGSQERYIIPSDLQETYDDGTPVYYEYRDGDKIVRKTAKEFKEEYEATIAENIQDSIDNLFEELGLKFAGPDAPRLRNIALSKILQKEILSSPRYGVDLYIACSVNSDGEFKVPLGDPIQSKRVEQLINSIIKNRINKQKIAGGPVVQVSNFGMSKRLSIKFKDKKGNILPTLNEWLKNNKSKTDKDYIQYLKENQAGVAHYECYAPAYMQEIFECFMDEKGNIDVKAMEKANPELLEMIGYRIPSEDLYSVAPLKIVGFLPKEAGEGLMLPYEIVFFTGSDFDKHHC